MRIFRQALNPEEIVKITGGELLKRHDTLLNHVADPQAADEHSVLFLDNENYLPAVLSSSAGLIIARHKYKSELLNHSANLIFTENAYQSVLKLVNFWLETEDKDFVTSIHPAAVIAPDVILPEHCKIGAYAVIEAGTTLGDYTIIDPFCYIGQNCRLGEHCRLYAKVTLYENTEIGNNVIIHSGCVIGADGFGYLLLEGRQQKIPQIGQVIINDNVEIGANTTIDRGTIGPTIIGEGTKIDNLVQIGHNCVIGKHCILCAQVGLAGSTTLGDYVCLAGQVGVADHLTIGEGAVVGAQSGVSNHLPAGGKYFGYPARDAMLMKRIMAVENDLPELIKFMHKLQKDRKQE
ncbi:MAG TPA: UDP-3-O-(3-hydroxymyristoyl)glucosamine N-acyltransferase [Candidatus Cloacimonadota bacterium]|nr:UDP-3-O-(3-hydroxymyristoyl)glucosamine N-acyltransferase [Candidatus Cloacimonadota bacterium]